MVLTATNTLIAELAQDWSQPKGSQLLEILFQEVLPKIPTYAGSFGPFVGQNWGARRYDRIRQALKLSFGFSLVFGELLAIALSLSAYKVLWQPICLPK